MRELFHYSDPEAEERSRDRLRRLLTLGLIAAVIAYFFWK